MKKTKLILLLFFYFFISNIQAENIYRYQLSACAIFKDDAPFLAEWIEYHKLLGVEYFILYNNDSTDDFQEVLRPYILKGEVTLFNWPNRPDMKGRWVDEMQWTACVDAITQLKGVSKWLALIDTDEFIVPHKESTINEFLKDYEDFGGVIISWQCFGTSRVKSLREGQLLTECLTFKANEKSEWNYGIKSIVKPERVNVSEQKWTPHLWTFSPPFIAVLPSKMEYFYGMIEANDIQINHYVHRTENYFYKVKVAKKERMENYKLSAEYIENWHRSCNQIQDRSILRFIPELKKRMFPNP